VPSARGPSRAGAPGELPMRRPPATLGRVAVAALLLTLAACGDGGSSTPAPAAAPDDGEPGPPSGQESGGSREGPGRILFVRHEQDASALSPTGEISVMNPDGTRQARLSQTGALELVPLFDRAATRITWMRRFTGGDGSEERIDVYVMDADGSEMPRLTRDGRADFAADWR
jgi:hypothetical protein